MAASTLTKPLRRGYVTALAGLASTLGLGQAMYLKATYQSPPDARGPRSGVEISSSSTQRPSSTTISQPTDEAAAIQNASTMKQTEMINQAINSAILKDSKEQKQILIIGDSLVSGVGGVSSFEDGPSDGPALPRQVAKSLSNLLNIDVIWKSMSLTGGDVRMLRRKIIPLLKRENNRGTLGNISAIVLVTGVNDWKKFSPKRTADIFQNDLKLLITDLKKEVGNDCLLFLPAIPGVRHTPRFHEPLRSIVIFLNELWDGQKLLLARTMKNVFFIGQPANYEWGDNPSIYFSALDRVHPSELGYTVWAERIAKVMKDAFNKVKRAIPSTSNNMITNRLNFNNSNRKIQFNKNNNNNNQQKQSGGNKNNVNNNNIPQSNGIKDHTLLSEEISKTD